MKVIALILAGGSGTRLWPLSRSKTPKQFLPLFGERTLLQDTCQRLFPLVPPSDQWIITGQQYYEQVCCQVEELKESCGLMGSPFFVRIFAEPQAKNTAPAVFWGARMCQELYGDDTIILVLPSDHVITLEDVFLQALQSGIEQAGKGFLVTFGFAPDYPETGYGYIKIEADPSQENKCFPVQAFVEKPDRGLAIEYMKSGNYLWNSGMFAFHVGTLIGEARKHCPNTFEPFASYDLGNNQSVVDAYYKCKPDSIDYAVMEKTDKAYVVKASFGWSDVGSWQSLYEVSPKNDDANYIRGDHIVVDSKGCLIHGEHKLIAVIGMEEVAVIDTPDALMICPMSQTQRVREIVEELKKKDREMI